VLDYAVFKPVLPAERNKNFHDMKKATFLVVL